MDLGFDISFSIDLNLPKEIIDSIEEEFIFEAIESNKLLFGGGHINGVTEGFITNMNGGGISQIQIKGITTWLDMKEHIQSYRIGKLKNAN